MPQYASKYGTVGEGPMADIFAPDTIQRFVLGSQQDAVDPYFGYGRFIYLKYPASQAVNPGRLLSVVDQTFLTADLPSTAGLGYPFVVARQVCASSATAQYGWFQIEGVCPLQVNASVAAGVVIGNAAAGVGGTNTAGKQLLGVKVLQPSTFNLTKAANTVNGSAVIGVSNVDGLFVGLTISGTGVSGTILSLDPSGRFITLSANATATGAITATFTYTGFVLAHISCPFTQGAIT